MQSASLRHCVPRADALAIDAAAIEALAYRVQRLAPHYRDPEKFHIDKGEIVGELRRLADASRSAGRR